MNELPRGLVTAPTGWEPNSFRVLADANNIKPLITWCKEANITNVYFGFNYDHLLGNCHSISFDHSEDAVMFYLAFKSIIL